MLKRLLSQNEFELLLPDPTGAKEKNTDKTDIRLVYQMNDTIESFLVFKEARMTGTYKEDYEGAIGKWLRCAFYLGVVFSKTTEDHLSFFLGVDTK